MSIKELIKLLSLKLFSVVRACYFMLPPDAQKAENHIRVKENTLTKISGNGGLTIIAPNVILKKERDAEVTDFAEADTPSDPANYKTNSSLPENKVKYHADLQRLTPRIPFRRA